MLYYDRGSQLSTRRSSARVVGLRRHNKYTIIHSNCGLVEALLVVLPKQLPQDPCHHLPSWGIFQNTLQMVEI